MTGSRAALRLRAAMTAAAAAGDISAWLTAATSLQGLLERQDPDAANRAELRRDMLAALEQLRRRWRSRPGRLWVSQDADQVTGPLLRDLLDDADADPAEVFRLTESARARVLLDALSGCFHGHSADPDETAESDRVLAFPPEQDVQVPVAGRFTGERPALLHAPLTVVPALGVACRLRQAAGPTGR